MSEPSPSIIVTLFLSQSIFTPLESESETAARRLPSASQSIEASSTTTPQLGAVARLVVELGGVEDGLGRDAGVVEAAPARLVALDHRGLLAELGGADRGDVAARATADDDHVERIRHDA